MGQSGLGWGAMGGLTRAGRGKGICELSVVGANTKLAAGDGVAGIWNGDDVHWSVEARVRRFPVAPSPGATRQSLHLSGENASNAVVAAVCDVNRAIMANGEAARAEKACLMRGPVLEACACSGEGAYLDFARQLFDDTYAVITTVSDVDLALEAHGDP